MVARNQPLRPIPAVGVGVASADDGPCFGEGEGVEACIKRGVAAEFNESQVDLAGGAVLQKVMEVVFLLGGCEARLV